MIHFKKWFLYFPWDSDDEQIECATCGQEFFMLHRCKGKKRKPTKVIFYAKNRRGKKKRITFVAD